MNAETQLRMLIGDLFVKLAMLMSERDELAEKLAALERAGPHHAATPDA